MISFKKLIVEAKEVKVYLQPGQKPPKGKKVVKGPKGGSYFMGSPADKKATEKKPASKKSNVFDEPKKGVSSGNGPKPLSQMGVEDPKEVDAKKEGAELSKTLSQKFGRNNFAWEETKVVQGQVQHWFGVEDEIVKLSKKLNLPISKNRDTYLRRILDNVKKLGLPNGYVPVMRTIENAHSGRTLSTGSFLVLVKGE